MIIWKIFFYFIKNIESINDIIYLGYNSVFLVNYRKWSGMLFIKVDYRFWFKLMQCCVQEVVVSNVFYIQVNFFICDIFLVLDVLLDRGNRCEGFYLKLYILVLFNYIVQDIYFIILIGKIKSSCLIVIVIIINYQNFYKFILNFVY